MSIWAIPLLTAIGLFQIVALPALVFRRNDFADVLWGPAFVLSAGSTLAFSKHPNLGSQKIFLFCLLTAWAVRLFIHVGRRNLSHTTEDVRYANWRRQWGKAWLWRSYLQVFILQPLILYVFLLPTLFILAHPNQPFGFFSILGITLWTIGFLFETIADEHLRRFKLNPANRGKIIRTGLWSWSRHPNYFGEVLIWWGIWLIAMELPGAWWTIVGPIGVTYLILKVSGVTMLEELMRNRPGYVEYEQAVSRFFPRRPRRRP